MRTLSVNTLPCFSKMLAGPTTGIKPSVLGFVDGLGAGVVCWAKAAIAVGADGLFIETHPDPKNAKSDGANMLHLDLIKSVLEKCVRIKQAL